MCRGQVQLELEGGVQAAFCDPRRFGRVAHELHACAPGGNGSTLNAGDNGGGGGGGGGGGAGAAGGGQGRNGGGNGSGERGGTASSTSMPSPPRCARQSPNPSPPCMTGSCEHAPHVSRRSLSVLHWHAGEREPEMRMDGAAKRWLGRNGDTGSAASAAVVLQWSGCRA